MALITWYQRATHGRPSPCRFTPSCSTYALEAFDTHGAARGGWITARRLLRCRPFGPSGYDPVPPQRQAHHSPHDSAHHSPHREPTNSLRTADHV